MDTLLCQNTLHKTKFGNRTIVLGSGSIDVLRNQYERKDQARIKAAGKWVEHGLNFTTRYGTPHHPRNILRDFKLLAERAALPIIRFHDLRHTAASVRLNHGIPVIVVSRMLGHAKPSITLVVYVHLLPSMQIEAAEKIDVLITPIALHRVAPARGVSMRLRPITPLYTGSIQVNAPTPGGILVGGTRLELATYSV